MKKLTISISILLLSNIAVADDISYRKNNLITVAAPADQEVPDEQTTETADEKELNDKKGLFGGRYGAYHTDIGTGKYGALHASLGLTGEWTDNLYNDKDDKIENLLTTLSAGAWYTFPKRSRKPIHIATNNTSTGGLQFSQGDNKFYNKHDFYIGGNLNYRMYSENSDLDMVTGTLTGMWSYTPSPKLSFQISDQYSINQDQFDRSNETSENQRVYGSNVLSAFVDWQITGKFAAKLQYSNFGLIYDDAVNDFLSRNDQGLGVTAYYDYSRKTNFFLQYNTVLASYEEEYDDINKDNSNGYWHGGINWQSTVRTTLMAKAGYQYTDYDSDEFDDTDTFNFELQWNWRVTVKTTVLLDSAYSIEQTDSKRALNKAVFAARMGVNHRFLNRLNGSLNFIYENSDYAQLDDSSRVDDRYNASIGLQFAFLKWLGIGANYSFDYKDSSIDELDYETNIFSLAFTGSF